MARISKADHLLLQALDAPQTMLERCVSNLCAVQIKACREPCGACRAAALSVMESLVEPTEEMLAAALAVTRAASAPDTLVSEVYRVMMREAMKVRT